MELSPDIMEDARRLVQAGANIEVILTFLRERGFDKIDSNYALRNLLGKQPSEAKNLIDQSHAWSDRFYTDSQVRETAREALRILAESNAPDLPKIIFEDGDK